MKVLLALIIILLIWLSFGIISAIAWSYHYRSKGYSASLIYGHDNYDKLSDKEKKVYFDVIKPEAAFWLGPILLLPIMIMMVNKFMKKIVISISEYLLARKGE